MSRSRNTNPAPSVEGPGSPTAEQVAAVVLRTYTIGAACNALRSEGWQSTITGNKIAINDQVFARFIDESGGADADAAPRWVVYGTSAQPAIWVIGTHIAAG
jgi:hypothetical protein